jgi:hypothetical protein
MKRKPVYPDRRQFTQLFVLCVTAIRVKENILKSYLTKSYLIRSRDLDPDPDLDPQLYKIAGSGSALNQC